jgi:hypothetical protein
LAPLAGEDPICECGEVRRIIRGWAFGI